MHAVGFIREDEHKGFLQCKQPTDFARFLVMLMISQFRS